MEYIKKYIDFNDWNEIDNKSINDLITEINLLNINEFINIKINNKCLDKIKFLINNCKIQSLHMMYKTLKKFNSNGVVFIIIKIYKNNHKLISARITKNNNYINICDYNL